MPHYNMKLVRGKVYTSTYLEHTRCHLSVSSRPHLFNEFCVGLCNFALHPQRIVSVDFGLILILEEVVCEWRSVAQALKESMMGAYTPSGEHINRQSWF